jgi:hypothetical protein
MTRTVVRNRRMLILGVVSVTLAVGFAVLGYIVITSPSASFDNPGGFTPAGRALAVVGCAIATLAFATFGVGGLRVALIIDDAGLVIRNPLRTTTVRWESKPRFETRDRRQEVTVSSPVTGSAPFTSGNITYRYREIVCVVGRQRIWIAATSRMTQRDRVEQLLKALRDASSQFASKQPRDVPGTRG